MITAWLALTLSLAAVTLFAVWSRRDTHNRTMAVLALLVAVPVAFCVLRVPLGIADSDTPPMGKYAIHGARIDVDVAIYVLVSPEGGIPHHYVLPYSQKAANALQQAMDASAQGDEGPILEMTEQGDAVFHAPPVRSDPPKQPEAS